MTGPEVKSGQGGQPSQGRRLLLGAELLGLFVVLPLAFRANLIPLPLFPGLWLVAGYCCRALLASRDFDRDRLWNTRRLVTRVRRAAIPFLVGAPVLLAATALLDPERLFGFVRERPGLWVLVMLFYPWLSVYPQGLIYRVFVLHRYRTLFPGRAARVVVSAAAFSMAHVVLENPVAPPLSFLGGLLFARTYERTGSALVTMIQHALFGCWIFTIGLGWYFYAGAVR